MRRVRYDRWSTEGLGETEPDLVPAVVTRPNGVAWHRLRTNYVALSFGGMFLTVVLLCLLAPVYSHYIAHIGPNAENITGTVRVAGRTEDVVSPSGIPIGPTWHARYLLGADPEGRDEAVRLLYGGRTSLELAGAATLITMVLATVFAVLAGYFGGIVDTVLSRAMDLVWSYPVILLGIALGVALATSGIDLGVVRVQGNSLAVPAAIIGIAYIPYVAKPMRARVLQLSRQEFVDAARVTSYSNIRIMFTQILPNLTSLIIVFIPLMLANSILLEAGLSFLGAGVQPPNASWGTMLAEGISIVPADFTLVLAPGLMLVLTVLGVNVFGDGVRDAFDPRAERTT